MARRRRLPTFLRPGETEALLAVVPTRRDRVIVACGLYLGLRVAEIVGLRRQDVDLAEGSVFVNEGKGRKDRYVPIPAKLDPILADWLAAGAGARWLFPSPRDPDRHLATGTVRHFMRGAKGKAGIQGKCTPHTLRHTYATRLLKSGANVRDIQQLLGHSSLAITETYLHVVQDGLKSVVDRL